MVVLKNDMFCERSDRIVLITAIESLRNDTKYGLLVA